MIPASDPHRLKKWARWLNNFMRWKQIKDHMNQVNAQAAVAEHNEIIQEIMALAEQMTVEEADQWSEHLNTLQSDIKADEAGVAIQEIDSPQIDSEDLKIERLNKQKKNAQIKKKAVKDTGSTESLGEAA